MATPRKAAAAPSLPRPCPPAYFSWKTVTPSQPFGAPAAA